MDFSTDKSGRILSMNYVETGGYSGELFAVYDNFGNFDDLLDVNGLSKWAAIYDLNNEFKIGLWNPPQGLDVPFGWNGKNGDITIQVGTDKDLIINVGGSNFSITNPWGATDDLGWAIPPEYMKDLGDGEACGRFSAGCFNGQCFSDCWKRETGRDWSNDRKILSQIAEIEAELIARDEISAEYTV